MINHERHSSYVVKPTSNWFVTISFNEEPSDPRVSKYLLTVAAADLDVTQEPTIALFEILVAFNKNAFRIIIDGGEITHSVAVSMVADKFTISVKAEERTIENESQFKSVEISYNHATNAYSSALVTE